MVLLLEFGIADDPMAFFTFDRLGADFVGFLCVAHHIGVAICVDPTGHTTAPWTSCDQTPSSFRLHNRACGPEIANLCGPLLPQTSLEKVGASPPAFSNGWCGRRGPLRPPNIDDLRPGSLVAQPKGEVQRTPTHKNKQLLQRRPTYKVSFWGEGALWILGFGVPSRPNPWSGHRKSTLPGPREGSSILNADLVVVTAAARAKLKFNDGPIWMLGSGRDRSRSHGSLGFANLHTVPDAR
jgi:hypothetical protein